MAKLVTTFGRLEGHLLSFANFTVAQNDTQLKTWVMSLGTFLSARPVTSKLAAKEELINPQRHQQAPGDDLECLLC